MLLLLTHFHLILSEVRGRETLDALSAQTAPCCIPDNHPGSALTRTADLLAVQLLLVQAEMEKIAQILGFLIPPVSRSVGSHGGVFVAELPQLHPEFQKFHGNVESARLIEHLQLKYLLFPFKKFFDLNDLFEAFVVESVAVSEQTVAASRTSGDLSVQIGRFCRQGFDCRVVLNISISFM